jgi:hypothetical protein
MDFFEEFRKAQEEAKKASFVNHYTNIEAMKHILANKSLKLRRIDKINDLMEQKRFNYFWEKKSFVSCFTSRIHESYFFWKAYANKSNDDIGIRITFPSEILEQSNLFFDSECTKPLPVIKQTNTKHNHYDHNDDWGLLDIYAYRIIYVENLENYKYIENWEKENFGAYGNIHDNFIRDALPAVVKTIEWDDEREIRILARVRPKGREDLIGKTILADHKYPKPSFDELFLRISDEILSRCSFTVSPINANIFDMVKQVIHGFDATRTCDVIQSVMLVDSSK